MFNAISYGMQIYSHPEFVDRVQFRYPKSKKKRIQKKFRKNNNNFKNKPKTDIYRIGNGLHMHPIMIEKLKKQIDTISNQHQLSKVY